MYIIGAATCTEECMRLYVETLTGFDLVAFPRKGSPHVLESFPIEQGGWTREAFMEAMSSRDPSAMFLGDPFETRYEDFESLKSAARSLGFVFEP